MCDDETFLNLFHFGDALKLYKNVQSTNNERTHLLAIKAAKGCNEYDFECFFIDQCQHEFAKDLFFENEHHRFVWLFWTN